MGGDEDSDQNLDLKHRWIRQHIRIHHECEDRVEKSVPRIAVWHHEACRVMTNGDPEGRIILSYPEYAKMQFHIMTLLGVMGKIAWVR